MEPIEQGKHKRQNGRLRAPTHVSHYSHVFSDSINSIPPASYQHMKGTNENVPHSFSAPAVAKTCTKRPPFIAAGRRFGPAEGWTICFLARTLAHFHCFGSGIYGATGRRN
jgi:hypothetical protein